MEVKFQTWFEPMPEPPELMTIVQVPIELMRVNRLVVDSYIYHILSSLLSMVSQNPNIINNAEALSNIIWNVQGAGSREFLRVLKELMQIHRPKVLTLVETHMGGDFAVRIAFALGSNGHARVDAQGFIGGIWVYRRPDQVSINPIIYGNQYITMEISRVGEIPWIFSTVYSSPDPFKRQTLWEELKEYASKHNKPWLIAGDFNETRYGWERSSYCNDTWRRAARFNEWIDDMNLIEIEFSGVAHTWA